MKMNCIMCEKPKEINGLLDWAGDVIIKIFSKELKFTICPNCREKYTFSQIMERLQERGLIK